MYIASPEPLIPFEKARRSEYDGSDLIVILYVYSI